MGTLPGLAKRAWGESGFRGSFDRAGAHGAGGKGQRRQQRDLRDSGLHTLQDPHPWVLKNTTHTQCAKQGFPSPSPGK